MLRLNTLCSTVKACSTYVTIPWVHVAGTSCMGLPDLSVLSKPRGVRHLTSPTWLKRMQFPLCVSRVQRLESKGHTITPSSLRRIVRSCCVLSQEMARPASMSSSSSSTRSRVVCMPICEPCTLPVMIPSEVILLLWTKYYVG